MAKPKIYIDGKEGTTGLQIYDRLAKREDIELLLIDEAKRKDTEERRKLIHAADIVFLCLPDAAAVEAVALAEGSGARIIDASTAHRTAKGWAYGMAELSKEHREAIKTSRLPCNWIYHFCLSAGGARDHPEGLSDDSLFPDRLFRRRQKDDCRV